MDASAPKTYRVIASYGKECLVQADGEPFRAAAQRRVGKPVCNDRVHLTERSGQHLVDEIIDRENIFVRAGHQGEKQVIAANLDRLVIVVAPKPAPTRDLINRYLVAAHLLSIPAVLCLNKIDLLDESQDRDWTAQLDVYSSLGYPAVSCSAKADRSMSELRELLSEGTSIFVGQSGVGKSSLVNTLLPGLELPTQDISQATQKGRHTTTAAMLYDLPGGGSLVDSPGVWEYGLWKMDETEIAAGFKEFQAVTENCRFNNCLHRQEPGCAISAAVADGRIDTQRYQSYLRILESLSSLYGRNR